MKKSDLLPRYVLSKLPELGATGGQEDMMVQVKFFYPDFSWTWYPLEFDGDDLFFGLVVGFEKEFGYFRLSELLDNRGKWGMEVERDLYFTPCLLSTLT